ncbi:TetR/AcrR family transcriptional regulator [Chachezhania sediminis]|uniref:TetR/AcrR family transcriptional regulator n=1 Tax=Chachezhania sediminis TaxID=2599291 RepID=UPI00131E01B5|nr:TetR/AcrR family transcriptional regulator [Chachezhania sediminis]
MTNGKPETPDLQSAEPMLAEAELNGVRNEDLVRQRREQICDAALELFLMKGFAATTIRDICAGSGVNQASIYDYIANKNDILRRLLNQLWFRRDVVNLPELMANQDLSMQEVLARYFREAWAMKRKGTLLAYRSVPHMQAEDRKAMRMRERKLIEDLCVQLHRRAGNMPDDKRVEVIANLLVFLTAFAPMRDWLTRDIPNEDMVQLISAGAAAAVEKMIDEICKDPANG